MKNTLLLWLNTVSLLLVLVVNYLYGSGSMADNTVGEISAKYPTLITPAGYAFSIWGLIYLLLIGFVVYQWVGRSPEKDLQSLQPAGIWFFISNLANAGWIIAWTSDQILLSLLLIFVLLFSLIKLCINLRLEIWDAPVRQIALVWWPICIYTGWVILATVLNVAVFLKASGWEGGGIDESIWAALVLVVAGAIYIFLTFHRNMRETTFVATWGLIAIVFSLPDDQSLVWWTALLVSVIVFGVGLYHGMKNHDTTPVEKWKRGEI